MNRSTGTGQDSTKNGHLIDQRTLPRLLRLLDLLVRLQALERTSVTSILSSPPPPPLPPVRHDDDDQTGITHGLRAKRRAGVLQKLHLPFLSRLTTKGQAQRDLSRQSGQLECGELHEPSLDAIAVSDPLPLHSRSEKAVAQAHNRQDPKTAARMLGHVRHQVIPGVMDRSCSWLACHGCDLTSQLLHLRSLDWTTGLNSLASHHDDTSSALS